MRRKTAARQKPLDLHLCMKVYDPVVAARLATRTAILLLAVLASVSMVGCGTTGSASSAPAVTGSSVDAGAPKLLQFAAPLVGGGEFDGTSVAGRPVAFWFWAPT